MTDRIPVGDGLPVWLDTRDYLSAPETRDLPEVALWHPPNQRCPICDAFAIMERAHIARKQAGGRKKGESGPTVWLCQGCHTNIDQTASMTLAIQRDTLDAVLLSKYRPDRRPNRRILVPGSFVRGMLIAKGWRP